MAMKLICPRAIPRILSKRCFSVVAPLHNAVEDSHTTEDRSLPPPRSSRADLQLVGNDMEGLLHRVIKAPLETVKAPTKLWRSRTGSHSQKLIVYPSPPSALNTCPDPVSAVRASQIAVLDPTGVRTRLFAKTNPECARVGDILLVRQRTGDPFAGVCINIRRRGIDTAILLRGQLTRVGVEVWYKVYSPLVEAIEVVQRAAKRARRARLTYMRKEKHDRGDVSNVVRLYLRQKQALGIGEKGGKPGGGMGGLGQKKGKGKGKGKKR